MMVFCACTGALAIALVVRVTTPTQFSRSVALSILYRRCGTTTIDFLLIVPGWVNYL